MTQRVVCLLRRIFFDPQVRAVQLDWQSLARFAVAAFRADTARAGASANVQALVEELRRLSPEFEMMCRENDVRTHGEGTKHFRHPVFGQVALEYSSFSVDGRADLSLVIYNPATPKDANRIRGLVNSQSRT
jgi:MmyB-like transcription regulator ligand binding domain